MKSTTYTRFCRRLFANTFERLNISETTKNRLLEKADIAMLYQEYYSMVLIHPLFQHSFFISYSQTILPLY